MFLINFLISYFYKKKYIYIKKNFKYNTLLNFYQYLLNIKFFSKIYLLLFMALNSKFS